MAFLSVVLEQMNWIAGFSDKHEINSNPENILKNRFSAASDYIW